jgi:peptidoglycan/LPS O-acetylase OafA/YrhL
MLNSLKYRPDIDGLRALAVIAVIIFHCYSFAIPSGYVGVDIFFVISGFLITKIILKDQQLGNFSFAKFYLRRIRRIFPALFFMLFCSFILAFITLPSGDMLWFSRGFYYASLQISNLFFQRGVDYFNEERNFEPLLHTWPLGVEEQFYLLTPFILLSLFRFSKNKKAPLFGLVALSLVSLVCSEYLVNTNQKIAFYSLLSRFWELGIGCLLAFSKENKLSSAKNNLISCAGFVAVIASFLFIKYENFPGLAALLPCIGTALIIFSGESQQTFLARFLANRIFVFIGKISYSLYLWHLPLLVFYKEYTSQKTLDLAATMVLLAIIFIVAFLSWRFIETPFRKTYTSNQKKIFSINKNPFFAAALCILFFTSLGKISDKTHGLNFRLTENKILDDEDLDQYGSFIKAKHCGFSKQNTDFPDIEECAIGENKKDFEVVIFGDSHAGHYSTSAVSWSEKRNMSVASLYFFACAPFLAEKTPSESATKCSEYREKVLQILQDKPNLKYVFLGSSWFDANKNNSPEDLEIFKNNLSKSIKAITDLNKTVIILGRVPNFNVGENDESPLECIEQELVPLQKIFKTTSSKCTSLEIKSFAEQLKVQDLMKQEVAKYKNAFFFDPFPYFCDDVACSAVKNENLLYADSGHLNENGSKHIAQSDFFPLEIISNKKQLGKNK